MKLFETLRRRMSGAKRSAVGSTQSDSGAGSSPLSLNVSSQPDPSGRAERSSAPHSTSKPEQTTESAVKRRLQINRSTLLFSRKREKRPNAAAAMDSTSTKGPQEKGKKARLRDFEISPKKVKREEVMIFCRQMSSFVRAGIPVIEALAIVSEDSEDRKLCDVLAGVTASLRGGSSLTAAMEPHSASFPKYFISMIRSAELTGRLDEVLDQLATYIDRDVETRRKLKSAMTYPSVVFVMAIVSIFVLAMFVLPKFVVFFESFDAELPWATRVLIGIAAFMGAWGLAIALMALWLSLLALLLTRREPGKVARDRIFLSTPKIGLLLRTASVERFSRILAVLVRAGVPLPDALAVASDTTGNRVYKNAIVKIRTSIMRGNGLAGPVQDSKLFPAAARQMIRVGESTGTLEEQLAASAEFYGRELEYKLKRFTDLFEPAIVVFMGIVVGFVAYALVSAMYGVFNQVNM